MLSWWYDFHITDVSPIINKWQRKSKRRVWRSWLRLSRPSINWWDFTWSYHSRYVRHGYWGRFRSRFSGYSSWCLDYSWSGKESCVVLWNITSTGIENICAGSGPWGKTRPPSGLIFSSIDGKFTIEPHCEKTCLWGFQPGPTQTGLYGHRRLLETLKLGIREYRDCTIYVAKTKVLISCVVTAQLICIFVFAYAKSRFSHGIILNILKH